ncbi:MAG: CDP-alcohol phosphatidyltransferase family protein [Myxococcota bacterium]|nr:CDP-alcohol phosphatidyltransferase family protein [Myxococcota bacterium]
MLTVAARVYRETRKKHDQLFNVYFMRPIAAVVVAAVARTRITPNQVTLLNLAIFVGGVALLIALPTWRGGLAAVAVIELSYCLDCVDGMLARFKRLASRAGHLFDFFTDELKAILLVAALAVRAWRCGGVGVDGSFWSAFDPRFLLAGIVGAVAVASALSLTNFVRNPELSGRGVTVEAYYETVQSRPPKSVLGQLAFWATTFLRFLNHYPSHLWVWALAGRLEVFFWIWVALNVIYLARGWFGLVLRFGRR